MPPAQPYGDGGGRRTVESGATGHRGEPESAAAPGSVGASETSERQKGGSMARRIRGWLPPPLRF